MNCYCNCFLWAFEHYKILPGVIILLTFVLIQLIAVHYGKSIVSSQGQDLQRKIQLEMAEIPISREDLKTLAVLNSLAQELLARGNASLSLVAEFTRYSYIAIIASLASGTLGGVAAFIIALKGWDNSNQIIQGLFLGCAGTLSFWLAASQVFKYQETIVKHEAIYTACANFLAEIKVNVGLVVDIPAPEAGEKMAEFIREFSKKLEALRAIGISFDGSKIGFAKIELIKKNP